MRKAKVEKLFISFSSDLKTSDIDATAVKASFEAQIDFEQALQWLFVTTVVLLLTGFLVKHFSMPEIAEGDRNEERQGD